MRIAMTIHALFGGGAERVMSRLATRWAGAGHEVHVITWATVDTDRFSLPSNVTRHGLDRMQLSKSRWQGLWANFRRVRALRSALQAIQPELVVSFCDQMNIVTLQAARSLPVPVWIAERSDPARQRLSPIWEFWRKTTYPRCAGCVALTPQIAEYLSRWIPRQRILILPNAVDVAAVAPASGDPTEPCNELRQPAIALALGRLSHEKGIDVLIDAWRQIEKRLAGWQLHIVGEGAERATLQQQCRGLDSVKFLGWLDDPWRAYRRASLFVLPSRYEGFPNALVEAMSQRLACIATRSTDAVVQLARNGSAVFLVDAGSADQLAAAILELAENPVRRQQLGQAAEEVSRAYSWSQMGPQWDQLLHSVSGTNKQ